MRTGMYLCGVTAMLICCLPVDAAAQERGKVKPDAVAVCEYGTQEGACCACINGGMVDLHNFHGTEQCTYGSSCASCEGSSCPKGDCHYASDAEGSCETWHDACASGFALAVGAAVRAGSAAVYAVAREHPEFVRVVDSAYVILMDCTGRYVVEARRLPKVDVAQTVEDNKVTVVAAKY